MIYLASPYSHSNPATRERRFRIVCREAARMMRHGQQVFSPIAHTHPIAQFDLPKGWEFWEEFDRWYISRCDEVVVLMLRGWRESKGVQAEIKIAEELGKPVSYIEPLPE